MRRIGISEPALRIEMIREDKIRSVQLRRPRGSAGRLTQETKMLY